MLAKQKRQMVNSMNALKKPEGLGKVFLPGEYWEGGDETQRDALVLGYGVLYENGNDISVLGDMEGDSISASDKVHFESNRVHLDCPDNYFARY